MDAREAIAGSVKFLLIFGILFSVASFALTPVGLLNDLALESTKLFLWASGVNAEKAGFADGFPLLRVDDFPYLVQINDLCAAKIEFAVLLGIIFASTDRSLRERLKGFAAGVLLTLLFNPLRIGLTIIFFNPIIHDILFRLMLVILIVSYYALWYGWLSVEKPRGKHRKTKKN